MNKYALIYLLFFIIKLLPGQVKSSQIQTINNKKYYIHKIEKGQSLYSLTKLYEVKLDDIYAENPELKDGVRAGQEIKIPYKEAEAPKPNFNDLGKNTNTSSVPDTSKYISHRVQKGETVYGITKKYNLSAEYFDQLNPDAKYGIKEGQLVYIGTKNPVQSVRKPEQSINNLNPNSISSDSADKKNISFGIKQSYNLALILPFKLDELDYINPTTLVKNNAAFPPISALAVDFYLGFKYVADSLKASDFNLQIDLHDIDDKDSSNLINLTNILYKKPYDLIVGPVYASSFKTISQTAKELNIPIVAPLTQQNKFLYNNIFASKVTPSQYTLLEELACYLVDSLKKQKVKVLLNISSDKDNRELNFVKAFRQYYNDKIKKSGFPLSDTIITIKGIDGVKRNYSDGQKHIVVSLTQNQVLITDFTTQLAVYANKKDISLCGWQSTTSIDNLDQNYLNQLNYLFPSANRMLNQKNAYASFIDKYKEQVGNGSPDEYFYLGVDLALYYLKNLKQYGKDFIFKLDELNADLNYLRFKFKRPDSSTGFDNTGVYIYRYNNYQLVETGWK